MTRLVLAAAAITLALDGCALGPRVNPADTITPAHVSSLAGADGPIDPRARYLALLQASSAAPNDATGANTYLAAGLTVAKLNCVAFFRSAEEAQAHRTFLRSGVNSAAGVSSAALGLAAVSAPITGGIGAAFAFANTLFADYDAAYLATTDLGVLQDFVQRAELVAEQAIGDHPPATFWAADRLLADYVGICTLTTMRRLVGDAVARAKPVCDWPTPPDTAPPRPGAAWQAPAPPAMSGMRIGIQ